MYHHHRMLMGQAYHENILLSSNRGPITYNVPNLLVLPSPLPYHPRVRFELKRNETRKSPTNCKCFVQSMKCIPSPIICDPALGPHVNWANSLCLPNNESSSCDLFPLDRRLQNTGPKND